MCIMCNRSIVRLENLTDLNNFTGSFLTKIVEIINLKHVRTTILLILKHFTAM